MSMNPPRKPTTRERINRQLDRPVMTLRNVVAFGIGFGMALLLNIVGS